MFAHCSDTARYAIEKIRRFVCNLRQAQINARRVQDLEATLAQPAQIVYCLPPFDAEFVEAPSSHDGRMFSAVVEFTPQLATRLSRTIVGHKDDRVADFVAKIADGTFQDEPAIVVYQEPVYAFDGLHRLSAIAHGDKAVRLRVNFIKLF